jgi:predicted GNAT superfamily acetyltransferase
LKLLLAGIRLIEYLHHNSTTMKVEVKELVTFEQFDEISELQKKIWNLSERDMISTITLKALTMNYPPMGLVLGAYVDNKLTGFSICLPTRETSTIYGLIMGVLPEFQNSEIGNFMGLKTLELCRKQNITKICWTYEPLESAHGHLYLNKWGAIVVRYQQNYYHLKDDFNKKLPMDRFIVDCNLHSNRVIERVKKKIEMRPLEKALNLFPLADGNVFPKEKAVLVRIPADFQKLKNEKIDEAIQYRHTTRIIFEEYITKQSYFIAELISGELNGERQSYYLLEKRSYI